MKRPIALMALLAVLWLAPPAAAAAPTVVLGNAILEVAAGQTEPMSVIVTEVQDLYGLELHLRFDPAVVQVADADPGKDGIQVAAGDFLSADFVAQNQADNQAGSIDYAVTQVNPNEPKSGSGTLLVIQFQGGTAGSASQLEVVNGILTTRDGDLIPATFTSGEVRVKGGPATAGNATATPTTPASGGAAVGDPPTATRALTNTPVPAPSNAAPSAELAAASSTPAVSPVPTEEPGLSAIVASTSTSQAAAADAETSVPVASVAQAPSSAPTSAPNQPTPALVAKASSGSSGKAILETGTAAKSTTSEPAPATAETASSWLLIGAVVLISLAVVGAGVTFWLSAR